jgi:hypothetical protein
MSCTIAGQQARASVAARTGRFALHERREQAVQDLRRHSDSGIHNPKQEANGRAGATTLISSLALPASVNFTALPVKRITQGTLSPSF